MDWKKRVDEQLALDFNCAPEKISAGGNCFAPLKAREGSRGMKEPVPLKVACVHGKLLFQGRPEILRSCREVYETEAADWFLTQRNLRKLEELLRPHGCRVGEAHPFYVGSERTPVNCDAFDVCWYEGEKIEQFRGDSRFSMAYCFWPWMPDKLGVSLSRNGEILAMAGASADSPTMWQIGINVTPQGRGLGVGVKAVTLLKNEILKRGKLPFYGTAASHIRSQQVAIRSGFLPAWAELYAEEIPEE